MFLFGQWLNCSDLRLLLIESGDRLALFNWKISEHRAYFFPVSGEHMSLLMRDLFGLSLSRRIVVPSTGTVLGGSGASVRVRYAEA